MTHNIAIRIMLIAKREVRNLSHRPMLLFCMFIAPVMFMLYLTSLMGDGTPTLLPCAIVDEDNTATSRGLLRTMGSMEGIDFTCRFASFSEAREAMRKGKVYAFVYLPMGLSEDMTAGRQPRISFYVNNCYYVAASQVARDMKTVSELAGMSATISTLQAKGMTAAQAKAAVQPITVEAHPLGNPTMDYSAFLNNMLVPGIILLTAMLTTIYSLGMEWKQGTRMEWYALSGRSPHVALAGKLLPQTITYTLLMGLVHTVFFRFLGFPCHCGVAVMMAWGALAVLAAQGFAAAVYGLFAGKMRLALCVCSLWGILSFSLAGLSFPVMAMGKAFQWLAWLEPLRHYYLIYVNYALNGYSIIHVWPNVLFLLAFALLPWLMLSRYRHAILTAKYVP